MRVLLVLALLCASAIAGLRIERTVPIDHNVTNGLATAEYVDSRISSVYTYNDDRLILSGLDGQEEVGNGTYIWSAPEFAWYLNGFDVMEDHPWLIWTNTAGYCTLYGGYAVYYTNDAAVPWDGTWSIAEDGIATNAVYLTGLTGSEEDGNGTYVLSEYWKYTSVANPDWWIAWNDEAWAVFTNDTPTLAMLYTNSTVAADAVPRGVDWDATDGACAPTTSYAISAAPTVTREAGIGTVIQSPWVVDVNADGHTLSNLGAATDATMAATKGYVDGATNALHALTNDIFNTAQSYALTNDAATKGYVDAATKVLRLPLLGDKTTAAYPSGEYAGGGNTLVGAFPQTSAKDAWWWIPVGNQTGFTTYVRLAWLPNSIGVVWSPLYHAVRNAGATGDYTDVNYNALKYTNAVAACNFIVVTNQWTVKQNSTIEYLLNSSVSSITIGTAVITRIEYRLD